MTFQYMCVVHMTFQYMTGTGYAVKPFYWVFILGSCPIYGGVPVAHFLHFLSCVVFLCFVIFVLCLVCTMLPVSLSLGCPFLIVSSVFFSNGYLLNIGIYHTWATDMYIDAIIHEPNVTIIRGRCAYVLRRTMLWDSKRFHGVVLYHQHKRRHITQRTILISCCWQSSHG